MFQGKKVQQQIKLRASRMDEKNDACFILSETNLQNIFVQIRSLTPKLVVIDSVQTLQTQYLESSPRKRIADKCLHSRAYPFCQGNPCAGILVGHITKDGMIAGPKILEHMVDTVLQFEGDRNHIYRILRAQKNRFGATSEIGIYEMQSTGAPWCKQSQ